MEINLGNYKLVHSGVIISIKDNPIVIKLPDEIEGDYTFILNFINNKEEKESITKCFSIDKFILQIDFINFNGFMGGGNKELVPVGRLRNLPLFLNYRVFDLTEAGKTIMFNFYTKKEIE